MSTDALGYTLGLLAVGMSMVAVRNRNMLLTVGASALWATLMAFIIANTVAGSNWQSMFLLSAGAFIMAMILIGAMGRDKSEAVTRLGFENGDIVARTSHSENMAERSPLDMSPSEYKAYIHKKTHPRPRGR